MYILKKQEQKIPFYLKLEVDLFILKTNTKPWTVRFSILSDSIILHMEEGEGGSLNGENRARNFLNFPKS